MCNLRRAKPSTRRPRQDEEHQTPYPYALNALQHHNHPRSAQGEIEVQRFSRSTNSSEARESFGSSIRSYATNLSLRQPSEPPALSRASSSSSGERVGLATLPTELLEAIFLLAIQTSFPIEDPNWPLCPMFSKRSYRHSPSNSGSGYGQDSPGQRTPPSAKRTPIATPALLTSAPHLLPTVLSQTCRRFRFILRHAPNLWSYICITRTVPHPHGQPPLLARQLLGWVPIYLARVRDSALHITLDATKFASFSAPISHRRTDSPGGNIIHPQSILGVLLPTLPRWASVTVLASHIGSATLAPLLELLSPLAAPHLTHFRVAADIWRPGIVGYGSPIPRLFAGGCPELESVVLEGIPLDWKSCAGVDLASGVGLFSSIRNLELRFIAGRYPRWEQFAILLEEGCQKLERLVVRDDFDEVLRILDPPPLPYSEDRHSLPEGSSSASARTSSASTMTRMQSQIASLHITLPSTTSQEDRRRGIHRSRSTSSSSSESSSGSSSPTSAYHTHQEGRRRRANEREFRKIHLPGLKHLEVHAFNSTGSRSILGLQSHSSSPSTSISHNPAHAPLSSIARFMYLFSIPSIHSLNMSGLSREEWLEVAGMLGLPVDAPTRGAVGKGLKAGTPPSGGVTSTFPLLTTLTVELVGA